MSSHGLGPTQWQVLEHMTALGRPVTIQDLRATGLTTSAASSALFRLIQRDLVRPTDNWRGIGYPRTWELVK